MALDLTATSAAGRLNAHRGVRVWLVIVAILVVAMIAVGGATRLTDSGLSITEWQPIVGAIPPLSQADWQDAFEKYKQIPEYREVNQTMDLAGFKVIFWWEWAHRFLGRLIGLTFAVPLAWFWMRGQIPPTYRLRLLMLLGLGGLQGFIGWYMVQSGLSDRVDVSQYRLALHLCMAFLILALLVWTVVDLAPRPDQIYFTELPTAARMTAAVIAVLVLCQVALGAFVAGTKAGLVYTTWPLMDGQLVPDGLFGMTPWYVSMFEDHLTIQFNHRMVAYVLVVVAALHAARLWSADNERVAWTALLLALLMLMQAGLGIWTLIAVNGFIPITLGIGHQTLAAIVFAVSIWHVRTVMRATP